MPNLGAIISKAIREAAKIAGNSGNAGNALFSCNEIRELDTGRLVTTPPDGVVTLVTDRVTVTSVTSAADRLVTAIEEKKHLDHQYLTDCVTTATTVTSENSPFREKSAADAMRRALLRNDLRLFERQISVGRCWVCQERETDERPLVPIMTASRGEHHWLHSECWPEHCRRIAERVEALMAESAAPF